MFQRRRLDARKGTSFAVSKLNQIYAKKNVLCTYIFGVLVHGIFTTLETWFLLVDLVQKKSEINGKIKFILI